MITILPQHIKQLTAMVTLLFLSLFLTAQNTGQVKWQLSSQKINEKEYSIIAKGAITPGWRIFTNKTNIEGLEKAAINFTDSSIEKIGTLQITGIEKTATDPVFEQVATTVENNITFTQNIKFTGIVPGNLKIALAFGFAKGSEEFFPEPGEKFDVKLEGGVDVSENDNRIKIAVIDLKR
jgi:hypothetical protein